MTQANNEIRMLAKERNVHLWEVARKYGCNDGNFSRKLRHELPESEKKYICAIIEHIADNRKEWFRMSEIKRFLTIEQTAEQTGLSVYYLRQGIRAGWIPHIKCGNKSMINFAKLIEFFHTSNFSKL